MKRGKFITFEGSEGCGKSTQIKLLVQELEKAGVKHVITREPGGTDIGEEIRHLLQHNKKNHKMTSVAELLLFAASRAQLVRERILPLLDHGTTVIADRFFDSTTVYQGVGRKLDKEAVAFVNKLAVDGCRPDLTILLDLSPDMARGRMLRRPRALEGRDRMEEQPAEFYAAVRDGYMELAAAEPDRITVFDGSQTQEAAGAQIWACVRNLLGV